VELAIFTILWPKHFYDIIQLLPNYTPIKHWFSWASLRTIGPAAACHTLQPTKHTDTRNGLIHCWRYIYIYRTGQQTQMVHYPAHHKIVLSYYISPYLFYYVLVSFVVYNSIVSFHYFFYFLSYHYSVGTRWFKYDRDWFFF